MQRIYLSFSLSLSLFGFLHLDFMFEFAVLCKMGFLINNDARCPRLACSEANPPLALGGSSLEQRQLCNPHLNSLTAND
jgi:hypothetical protein